MAEDGGQGGFNAATQLVAETRSEPSTATVSEQTAAGTKEPDSFEEDFSDVPQILEHSSRPHKHALAAGLDSTLQLLV